ncbi:hypothetical protein HYH02_005955 [Chlamydomonas schloesseri]|uniref:Uncharacterized protein n=1 Tax=Chlamydomonas schloesseri TaxID=2026947 RepID=A0A835WL00_9CHLO|nr:hypothetical protein HYH02_005955 [Chlamydomonas schloesseri]|eukprot:KAG2449208.1 hypothetical protein HYH02_005955 [Chlamydomonas schloesseri]
MQELTGARLAYVEQDHRVDIRGRRAQEVEQAARLLEKTLEHYQYSGMQFSRKTIYNILAPELSASEDLALLPCSRPVVSVMPGGPPSDGFVLSNPSTDAASSSGRQAAGSQASTSGVDERLGAPPGRVQVPLLRPAADLDACLQQLIDLAATVCMQHPADCDRMEIRLYLGKLLLTDVTSSRRQLPTASLLEWTYPRDGRAVFDTSLPQDTIRSLDSYLTGRGLTVTQQVKSASLHLETSIPWIQYHPTFAVAEDGALRISKLETLGCKPLTLALVGPSHTADVRLRYVASVQHGAEDEVAEELRRRQGEFALVNGTQVVVPSDLRDMDLTLTSARVKLKRVYVTPQPLPPPAAGASTTEAGAKKPRAKRAGAAAAASGVELPPVSLKVSAAGVVDNLGGKRLEVTVSCPELNAALMGLHRSREEPPGARDALLAQLRSLLAHVAHLRANVAFAP